MHYKKKIIEEIRIVCDLIDEQMIEAVADKLLHANRVLVVGVGRVLISMKAWVKRLRHLDIDINYVGSETEGPVGKGDVLLVASSSGESVLPVKTAELAKSYGVTVIYIGSNPESSAGALADVTLRIPCKTKLNLPDEFASFQPMSTLFEQVLYILGDTIAYIIMDKKGIDEAELKERHANLE